jgi:hypothetical protein
VSVVSAERVCLDAKKFGAVRCLKAKSAVKARITACGPAYELHYPIPERTEPGGPTVGKVTSFEIQMARETCSFSEPNTIGYSRALCYFTLGIMTGTLFTRRSVDQRTDDVNVSAAADVNSGYMPVISDARGSTHR